MRIGEHCFESDSIVLQVGLTMSADQRCDEDDFGCRSQKSFVAYQTGHCLK